MADAGAHIMRIDCDGLIVAISVEDDTGGGEEAVRITLPALDVRLSPEDAMRISIALQVAARSAVT